MQTLSQLDTNGWFNGWHFHPDMDSKCNRARSIMFALTYKLLRKAEVLMAHRGESAQVWASLEPDTGQSAIFIHTKNPYGVPFPYDFAGVEWGAYAPDEAEGIIDSTHEIGAISREDGIHYLVREKSSHSGHAPNNSSKRTR